MSMARALLAVWHIQDGTAQGIAPGTPFVHADEAEADRLVELGAAVPATPAAEAAAEEDPEA